MLGFKRFRSAAITISGIELMHRIRKGQFDLCALGLKDTATLYVWNAVMFNNKVSVFIEDISTPPAICTGAPRRATYGPA